MAGMTTTGTEELSKMFEELGKEAAHIAARALYEGAAVAAAAYQAATASIKTEKFHYAKEGETRLPSPEEKALLFRKTGISKFKQDASEAQTLIGVAEGYGMVAGQLRAFKQVANGINSGTSYMVKQPVYRKAANACKGAAQAAMIRAAEAEIKKITG